MTMTTPDTQLLPPWEPGSRGKGLYSDDGVQLLWWTTWQCPDATPGEPTHFVAAEILEKPMPELGCFAIARDGTLELYMWDDPERAGVVADLLTSADPRLNAPPDEWTFS